MLHIQCMLSYFDMYLYLSVVFVPASPCSHGSPYEDPYTSTLLNPETNAVCPEGYDCVSAPKDEHGTCSCTPYCCKAASEETAEPSVDTDAHSDELSQSIAEHADGYYEGYSEDAYAAGQNKG